LGSNSQDPNNNIRTWRKTSFSEGRLDSQVNVL
jgi:hypothetical protein